jgi:hypothetical protein
MPDATPGPENFDMTAVLRLVPHQVSEDDVLTAWAAHRALILSEVDDRRLLDDLAHQQAKDQAREKYLRLFGEWCRR